MTIDNRDLMITGLQQREVLLKREVATLRLRVGMLEHAVLEANRMVVRHTMPAGWPEFQARHGLPTAAEIIGATPPGGEAPR